MASVFCEQSGYVVHGGMLKFIHRCLGPDLPACTNLYAGNAAMGALTREGDTVETLPCSRLLLCSQLELTKEGFQSLEQKVT